MIRVMVVMGTRPEAIKLCPVIARLQGEPRVFETCVAITHQHEQMLDQVLDVFGVRPDFDLRLMRDNQTLNQVAWMLLRKFDPLLTKVRPDVVVVQGDTVTACMAGVASFYRGVPVAHVEAGLRTGNDQSPYPEEMNRRLLGVLASFHFAPTSRAVASLQGEGVPADRIYLTGNTVVDALHTILARDLPTSSWAQLDRSRQIGRAHV